MLRCDLTFMRNIQWPQLQEIYLSGNDLESINELSDFPNLRLIDASNNALIDVTLNLEKLESLNLSKNQL